MSFIIAFVFKKLDDFSQNSQKSLNLANLEEIFDEKVWKFN